MDATISALAAGLKVLFALGVLGCLLVIPATAVQLVKAMLERDSEEEIAGRARSA